jgi:HSP20 family protein
LRRGVDDGEIGLDRDWSSATPPGLSVDWRRPANAGPRVDLYDEGGALLVRAEVPGLGRDDVELILDRGVLTLRGERKAEPSEGWQALRRERAAWRFARSFALPVEVDVDRAEAEVSDGVLTLRLPKAPAAQPRRIAPKAS